MKRSHDEISVGTRTIRTRLSSTVKDDRYYDLENIIKIDDNYNSYQPTRDQCKKLERKMSQQKYDLSRKTIIEWLDFMMSRGEEFPTILFPNGEVYSEQKRRAKYLIEQVIKTSAKEIVLLDGHGRMLFLVLSLLREHDLLQQVSITVVDSDEGAHEWHELFFPEGVSSINEDLFQYVKKTPTKNMYIYANFCGLMGNTQELVDLIDQVDGNQLMISMSTRCCKCNHKKLEVWERCEKCLFVTGVDHHNSKFVSRKRGFITFVPVT